MDVSRARRVVSELLDEVSRRWWPTSRFSGRSSRGHVLLENVPGTGKKLTARSLAGGTDLSFSRIQFTPDLLPADITGSNVYEEATEEFGFSPGPVFANVVLADEINRAAEDAGRPVGGDERTTGHRRRRDTRTAGAVRRARHSEPGRTGRDVRTAGAQRDRFTIKTSVGYPDRAGERELLDRRADRATAVPTIDRVVSADRVRDLRQVPESVRVDGKLRDYVVDLGRAARRDDRVAVGASPRGIQQLFEVARDATVVAGREFAVPDDVKRVLRPVFAHRVVLTVEVGIDGVRPADVIRDVAGRVDVPAMDV